MLCHFRAIRWSFFMGLYLLYVDSECFFFGVIYCWVLDILLHWISGFVKRVQCWFGSFNWYGQTHSSALFLPVAQSYPRRPVKRRTGQSKPRWVLRFVLERFAEGKSYRQIVHAFNRLYAHRGMTISL